MSRATRTSDEDRLPSVLNARKEQAGLFRANVSTRAREFARFLAASYRGHRSKFHSV